ncbi:MAG TPA: hypothetical protein VF039_00565 [Longimicrobiales bacterium]
MAGLDFRRASDMFISSDKELGAALGIPTPDVARYRRNPDLAPAEVLARLGTLLVERGRAMTRVGELLQEENAD